ncbi:hypothetical protein [Burkholderia cepacia]|nr:hypothetical protein [Burkholderia cepacia]
MHLDKKYFRETPFAVVFRRAVTPSQERADHGRKANDRNRRHIHAGAEAV